MVGEGTRAATTVNDWVAVRLAGSERGHRIVAVPLATAVSVTLAPRRTPTPENNQPISNGLWRWFGIP